MKTLLCHALLGSLVLCASLNAPAQVVISEFMAGNTRTLADEDGDYSDWIEIHNAGAAAVNLLGWSLSDSSGDLTQWAFPATNLNAGSHLVVFASGKNRRSPGAPLHTNFRLSASGEYLALIMPDHTTIASEFKPAFPAQVSDVSYGIDSGFRLHTFLATNAAGRLVVPASGDDGTNWINVAFNDAGWLAATGGVGFAAGSIADLQLTNGLAGYWKFDETTGKIAADSSSFGNSGGLRSFPNDNSQWVPGKHGGALSFRGAPLNDYVFVTNYPKSTAALTVSAWIWADSRPTWATIAKNWPGGNASHFHFGLQDTGGDLSNYIRQNNADYGLREGTPLPLAAWQHVAFVLDANMEHLYRNGMEVAAAPYSGSLPNPTSTSLAIGAKVLSGVSADSYWDGKLDEVAIWNRALSPSEIEALAGRGDVIASQVATDIQSAMFRKNATAYLRFPFVVDNPASYQRWILRLRYNDGFIAWLNGQEIARRNAPEEYLWNSFATAAAPSSAAAVAEVFNLEEFQSLILAGTNVLAIQALNASAEDPDFFIAPVLDALSTVTVTNTLVYFTTPTPGSENLPGVDELGPIIGQVNHTPAVPSDDDDLVVTARVSPAFAAVASVNLRYRVMFTDEVVLPMQDDGAHGDGLAGDGVFGAAIPAIASTNGQMIRYAVTAMDASGKPGRAPLFNDPLDSDEYFGTVVANPDVTSALPVFQWFVAAPAAAETDTGTRSSLFYDGEFYDNIFVRIRGGTSRSWPKKSYKLEFNEDHEFALYRGQPRVTEFDLNTTYTDKSYIRSVLVYEHQRDVGLPSPICFLAHLRQNGAFHNVSVYTEQPDKDFLRRLGLDENGSFYKCGPGSTYDSPASFEKKTRPAEGNGDLLSLLAGLGLTGEALDAYVFDNLDVPGMVNFLATVAITQNIDASDKNHFLYRDTEGTGEWRMLPWDQDLTFGPDALNTDRIVFNLQNTNSPACASHPFIGARPFMLHAGKYNRLIESIVKVPRTRDMLLRRIRTLTDDVLARGYFQKRMDQLVPLITPDVALDKARWGLNAAFAGTAYTLAQATDRIKIEYLEPRLGYLSGTTIAAVGTANPATQPPDVGVAVAAVEANPASGNQAEEYLCVTNNTSFAIDLTGWRITGAVEFSFKPGTVITANGALYVVANVPAFRARSTGPRGGQGMFVAGTFSGQLSARGETLRLLNPFGQPAHSFTYPGAPSVAQQYLRITELMYHPTAVPQNTNGPEEFEFIELKNISTNTALSLAGVRFVDGVEFDFPISGAPTMPPGQQFLLVKNPVAFGDRYGWNLPIVVGQYAGSLENRGERIRLLDANGEEILDFNYVNRWYPITDGLGFSLVVADENADPDAWNRKSQWRTSSTSGGSPSLDDPSPPALAGVVINEALTRSDVPPPTDTIELHNPSANVADISGWFLSDDFNNPKKYRISDGTTIPAEGFVIVDETQFNTGPTAFALGSDGDEVWLFSADPAGTLTGYFHGFRFGAAEDGVTFGRHLTSIGEEYFVAQSARTLDAPNAGPTVGPVVITEIHYHPPDAVDGSDDSGTEFIELRNLTTGEIPLFNPLAPSNSWRLRGGISFEFPGNTTLTSGELILMVNFDPANGLLAEAFRARYQVAGGIRLFGPYGGKLGNDTDDLRIEKPTTPTSSGTPYVIVDRVRYSDRGPWPDGADGGGLSLQRRNPSSYGDDPGNWLARQPTAGTSPLFNHPPPTIVVQPLGRIAIAYSDVALNVIATGTGPLHFQWRFNQAALPGATNSTLLLRAIQPNQAGAYDVLVHNDDGSILSSNAAVSLRYPAFIQSQPVSVQVRVRPDPAAMAVTNAAFAVTAYSTSLMTYQWKLNGMAIPDATNSSLIITNVQVTDGGDYSVEISDAIGTVSSAPAALIPLVSPTMTQGVISQLVAAGSTVTLSASATGSPLPFGFEWRWGSTIIQSNGVNSTAGFYSFKASSTPFTTNHYRVVVRNLANATVSANSLATIITLPDSDQDGMIDLEEQHIGLDPNNAADALDDLDGDGMVNREEFLAGTDPTNSASYLRVDQNTTPSQAIVQFAAVSNRTYSVQYTDSVGGGPWSRLADVVASPTNRVQFIADPAWTTNRFYRVVLPAQP